MARVEPMETRAASTLSSAFLTLVQSKALAALAVFLVAALPRTLDLGQMLVIDELLWLGRSQRFMLALADRDWAGTLQSVHPGVFTMWAGGLAMRLSHAAGFVSPGLPFAQTDAHAYVLPTQLGVGLVVSLGLVAVYWASRRIVPPTIALLGTLLLALDPFYVALSRILHLDALLSTAMLLSLLLALVYAREGRERYLWASGLVAGLAFLTKSPSLGLIPIVPLVLYLNGRLRGRALVRATLVWGATGLALFVLLYPAMWVTPLEAVQAIFGKVTESVSQDHDSAALGYTLEPFYYVRGLAQFSNPLALVGAALFAGLLYHAARRAGGWRRLLGEEAAPGTAPALMRSFLPLLAFAGLFFVVMTLSAKKGERYILPTYMVADLAAAAGLVLAAHRLKDHPSLYGAAVTGLLALFLWQSTLLVRIHPYYLSYVNPLYPMTERTKLGWGEGLEKAAAYLNAKPDAEELVAVSWYPEIFKLYFRGHTAGWDVRPQAWADYFVLYRGMYGRAPGSVGHVAVRRAQTLGQPEEVIRIRGLPYLWIYENPYKPQPGEIGTPLHVDLGQKFELLGYHMPSSQVRAGDWFGFVLSWARIGPVSQQYSVFVHVVDQSGQMVAQRDGYPTDGQLSTFMWPEGEVIHDFRDVVIPEDVPPGEYRVLVGLYLPETLERLAAVDASGRRMPEDAIELTTIAVLP